MTCPTCGAIADTSSVSCQLCGTRLRSQGEAGPGSGDAPGSAPGAASGSTPGPNTGSTPGPGSGPAQGSGAAPGQPGGGAWGGAGGTVPPPPPAGGYPGSGAWQAPQPHPSGLSGELRGWSIGAHLGGLVVGVSTAAVFGFVGPLLVWLFKRDEHPFTDHHTKEALNFQLTVLLVLVLSVVLAIPAIIVGVITFGIGLVLLGILAVLALVAWIVLPIIGAVKASNGEGYRYPLTIRFVS